MLNVLIIKTFLNQIKDLENESSLRTIVLIFINLSLGKPTVVQQSLRILPITY